MTAAEDSNKDLRAKQKEKQTMAEDKNKLHAADHGV
jgi:hypothetical protein